MKNNSKQIGYKPADQAHFQGLLDNIGLLSVKAALDHHVQEIKDILESLTGINAILESNDINFDTLQEIVDSLKNKSDKTHNHDGVYAPANHNHDTVYAAKSHSHSWLFNAHALQVIDHKDRAYQNYIRAYLGDTGDSSGTHSGQHGMFLIVGGSRDYAYCTFVNIHRSYGTSNNYKVRVNHLMDTLAMTTVTNTHKALEVYFQTAGSNPSLTLYRLNRGKSHYSDTAYLQEY